MYIPSTNHWNNHWNMAYRILSDKPCNFEVPHCPSVSPSCLVHPRARSVMAEAWQYIYSGQLLILFLLAQMAPIFFEVWMEARIGIHFSSTSERKCHKMCFIAIHDSWRLYPCVISSVFLVGVHLQILVVQAGIVQSTVRLVKQILTLSPIMFIFQAKAWPAHLCWLEQNCLRYLQLFKHI